MKKLITSIITLLLVLSVIARTETSANDPISERLSSLCAIVDLSTEDVTFLKKEMASRGPSECLSHAILYRHSQSEHGDEFRGYFAVDRSIALSVLANDEINSRVNGVLKEFKGRSPAEVMARVYLVMRGGGFIAKQADGTELNLEVMFRSSVFAAVSGGSKDEVRRLAAEADKK